MKIIYIKVAAFWLLFLLFCALLYFWWYYRVLWLALTPLMGVIRYTKPKLPSGPPRIALAIRLGFIVCVVACFVHAFYQS